MTLGGLVAGRAPGSVSRGLAALVATAALALVAGAATGRAAGLVLVAVAFGLLQIGRCSPRPAAAEPMTGAGTGDGDVAGLARRRARGAPGLPRLRPAGGRRR